MQKIIGSKELVVKVQVGTAGAAKTPVYNKFKLYNITDYCTDEDMHAVCTAVGNLMEPDMPKVFQKVVEYLYIS